MVVRSNAAGPGRTRRARALRSAGAGRTHGRTEGDPDRRMTVSVRPFPPPHAPLPWRADRVRGLPVEHNVGRCDAVLGLPLPTLVAWNRAPQVAPLRGPPGQAVVSTHITRLDARCPRRHRPRGEGVLPGGQHGNSRGGRRGGQHLGQERRRLVITGGGDMHRVPRPGRLARVAVARRWGIGGAEQPRRWRQVVGRAPAPRLLRGAGVERWEPDLAPGLQGRYRPQPRRAWPARRGPTAVGGRPYQAAGPGCRGLASPAARERPPPAAGRAQTTPLAPRTGARLAPPWPAPCAHGAACRRCPPADGASGWPPAPAWSRGVAGLWP
jgi:hypothetical protein